MAQSYSSAVKEALIGAEIKKKCCKRVYFDTQGYFDSKISDPNKLREVYEKIKCANCLKEFVAALFVKRGSLTDPEKQNHLDFAFENTAERDLAAEALATAGFFPKETARGNKAILYFKDNDTIGDLLAFLGATKAAFDVMNTKIVKELRNNANRLMNCDVANIEKALGAAQKYIDAINFIKAHGGLEALPSELYEAANLRMSFQQASLSELASKCNPPITKSGMKHRLEKLLVAAEDLKTRLPQ